MPRGRGEGKATLIARRACYFFYFRQVAKLIMTFKTGIMAMGLGAVVAFCGCASTPSLAGSVQASTYTSAEGEFSVPFPVSVEVGGRIQSDSAQSVTFRDNWGSRVTFSGLPIAAHSSIMSMMATAGREKALTEFAKRQYSDLITVHYHPELRDGMVSFIYLRPASPKTAVAIFIYGSRLYVVETDMLPGVQLLAQNDLTSQHEREGWLEGRAMALAQSIEPR
jgi:hypothetical protein